MKRIGISISNSRLSAYVWEKTLFSGRGLAACEIACTEPLGTPDDIRALAASLRESLGSALPPVVLSIPPGECHLRILDLPVPDLKNARIIHGAEIEDSLPFDGEDIVSDLFPMEAIDGDTGRYMAIAARRSALSRFTERFSDAGFQVESIVTDPVSLLCAASVLQSERTFSLASFETDGILLSVGDLRFRKVRQFPSAVLSSPEPFNSESLPFIESTTDLLLAGPWPATANPLPVIPLVPPGDFPNASVVAFGASLAPFSGKITHGFSLGCNDNSVDENEKRGDRLRFLAIACGIALVSCILALEIARWTSARQVAAVKKQLRAEFSAAVPEAKVIVREASQIREKVGALQRQRSELGLDLPGITPLLGAISAALPTNKSLTVKEISVDGNRLRVTGDSTGGPAVESYRSSLASSLTRSFDVTVQESRGSARGESVTFTILIEKRKTDRAS